MKVRELYDNSVNCEKSLTDRINEFIEDKKVIDIKYTVNGYDPLDFPFASALVMYEDETVKGEKVQLSKHVADWLDHCKSSSRSLQYAIDHATAYKENNPVAAAYLARGDEHLLTFVRAWFEGFTIENNKENGVCDQKPAENQQKRKP